MPSLLSITVYPIKSLDGLDLPAATVLPSGALQNDRRYALFDSEDRIVNGKRVPAIGLLRATYDDMATRVTLSYEDDQQTFSLEREQAELAHWCGKVLGLDCRMAENNETGFPDDLEAPGPTLISTGSLEAIGKWFPEIRLGETRRRFRANLEIDVAQPFWEDRLLSDLNPTHEFCIGPTRWRAEKICQRCAVPSRDSRTAEAITGFARDFALRREQQLPPWSPRGMFDHFFRFAINTRLVAAGNDRAIRVGDEVSPVGEQSL